MPPSIWWRGAARKGVGLDIMANLCDVLTMHLPVYVVGGDMQRDPSAAYDADIARVLRGVVCAPTCESGACMGSATRGAGGSGIGGTVR